MPRRRPGALKLDAYILGEHLHLDCVDCKCAASVVDYSVPDGFLVVECPKCGRREPRLKLWHHALWQGQGHGETAKEYRDRFAAFAAE